MNCADSWLHGPEQLVWCGGGIQHIVRGWEGSGSPVCIVAWKHSALQIVINNSSQGLFCGTEKNELISFLLSS